MPKNKPMSKEELEFYVKTVNLSIEAISKVLIDEYSEYVKVAAKRSKKYKVGPAHFHHHEVFSVGLISNLLAMKPYVTKEVFNGLRDDAISKLEGISYDN